MATKRSDDKASDNKAFEEERKARLAQIESYVSEARECLHEAGRVCMSDFHNWSWEKVQAFYNMSVFAKKAKSTDSLAWAIDRYKNRVRQFAAEAKVDEVLARIDEATQLWTAAVGVKNKATDMKRERKKANATAPGDSRPNLHRVK